MFSPDILITIAIMLQQASTFHCNNECLRFTRSLDLRQIGFVKSCNEFGECVGRDNMPIASCDERGNLTRNTYANSWMNGPDSEKCEEMYIPNCSHIPDSTIYSSEGMFFGMSWPLMMLNSVTNPKSPYVLPNESFNQWVRQTPLQMIFAQSECCMDPEGYLACQDTLVAYNKKVMQFIKLIEEEAVCNLAVSKNKYLWVPEIGLEDVRKLSASRSSMNIDGLNKFAQACDPYYTDFFELYYVDMYVLLCCVNPDNDYGLEEDVYLIVQNVEDLDFEKILGVVQENPAKLIRDSNGRTVRSYWFDGNSESRTSNLDYLWCEYKDPIKSDSAYKNPVFAAAVISSAFVLTLYMQREKLMLLFDQMMRII